MNKIVLRRACSYLRPLFYEDKEIEQIKIFNGESVYTVPRGWLEDRNTHKDIQEIEFESLKVCRKIDLTKKESFLCRDNDYCGERVLTLFLYTPDLTAKKIITSETIRGKTHNIALKFTLNGAEVVQHIFDYFEKSEAVKRAEALEKTIKEKAGVDVDEWKITLILEHFDIVEK